MSLTCPLPVQVLKPNRNKIPHKLLQQRHTLFLYLSLLHNYNYIYFHFINYNYLMQNLFNVIIKYNLLYLNYIGLDWFFSIYK